MPLADEIIAFEGFRLDLRRRQLRLASGDVVKLVGKPFDLLALLVAERERVVSQAEIFPHIWPNEVKSEGILSVNLSAVRKALAAHGGDKLILSVPGKGYRFIGEVTPAPAPPAPVSSTLVAPSPSAPLAPVVAAPALPVAAGIIAPPASRPYRAIIATLALAVIGAGLGWAWMRQPGETTAPLSVAVLPFRNIGEARSADYMAAAITDDLTTALALIPSGVVTARDSALRYGSQNAPPDQIGRSLHVRYLVEGSLRADDDGSHVNAALIEARSGQQVWSRHIDIDRGARGESETAIVRGIASALRVTFPRIVVEHFRPDDPEAGKAFYEALSIMTTEDSSEGYGKAVRLLERAVALAPDFGDALAELGLALVLQAQSAEVPARRADVLAQAQVTIGQALRLSASGTALAANARWLEASGDCAGAAASAREALALEPNRADALATLAKCEVAVGQSDQAAASLRKLLQIDPDPTKVRGRAALLSQALLFLGSYDEAIAFGQQALAGDPPAQPGADTMGRAEYARLLIISATALAGKIDAARLLYQQYRAIWPNRSTWRVAAYSPRGVATQPGFRNFVLGLQLSGMPPFTKPGDCMTSSLPSDPGDFVLTPAEIPPAKTIDLEAAERLFQQHGIMVLDVGHGAAIPRGAKLLGPDAIASVARPERGSPVAIRLSREDPIIVMGDGPCGSSTVGVIRQLTAWGYHKVSWFRGGEEAWAAAGRQYDDLRPQY